jgi:hypothetical protein
MPDIYLLNRTSNDVHCSMAATKRYELFAAHRRFSLLDDRRNTQGPQQQGISRIHGESTDVMANFCICHVAHATDT